MRRKPSTGPSCRAVLGRESRWVFVVSGHRSRTRGHHGVEGFTSKEGSAFCQTALFHSRMGHMVGGERLWCVCIPRHWFPEIFWGKCVLRSKKLEKYLLLSSSWSRCPVCIHLFEALTASAMKKVVHPCSPEWFPNAPDGIPLYGRVVSIPKASVPQHMLWNKLTSRCWGSSPGVKLNDS